MERAQEIIDSIEAFVFDHWLLLGVAVIIFFILISRKSTEQKKRKQRSEQLLNKAKGKYNDVRSLR